MADLSFGFLVAYTCIVMNFIKKHKYKKKIKKNVTTSKINYE